MDFREALIGALRLCGDHADDWILFENALCDMVGGDLLLKPQKECFLYFNKTFHLVAELKQKPEPRTLGILLEKCKKLPDAPEKLCLKWLHTLFEYYYQANSVSEKRTDPRLTKNQPTQSRLPPQSISQIKVPRVAVSQKKQSAERAPAISKIKVGKDA